MKTLEQRAEEYIEPFRTHLLGCETDLMKEAYIAGATEALKSQWHDYPEEDFPEDGSEYIVQTSGGDYCAINKYARKEMVKQYTNIIAWMPIPKPDKQ